MKYLSIDIETTGLDPEVDQVLMFSGVVEDTDKPLPLEQLPHITFLVEHERVSGNPFALAMNGWILMMIAKPETSKYQIYSPNGRMYIELSEFLLEHFGSEKITVAGKNIGNFDWQFIKGWFDDIKVKVRHKMLDPGSVYFNTKNAALLSLPEIKDSIGLEAGVSHDAYEDALDVIKVLRAKY